MRNRKIVLLIDAENTSARYAKRIVDYLEKRGDIICARIYGDFINNVSVKGWNSVAIEYEMEQKQQLTTSSGKNSSDIALVIDAMDLLYQKNIDTLCIVTSDGDFTGLVKRIREDGIEVIGIGKTDASKRLEKVCDQYLDFEELAEKKQTLTKPDLTQKKTQVKEKKDNKSFNGDKKQKTAANPVIDREKLGDIKTIIHELIQQEEKNGKRAELGGIKSQIQLKYPDFRERDYGYKTIREFIDKETKFDVVIEGRHTYVVPEKKVNVNKSFTEKTDKKNVVPQSNHRKYNKYYKQYQPNANADGNAKGILESNTRVQEESQRALEKDYSGPAVKPRKKMGFSFNGLKKKNKEQ
ncbi:MAG: NYN domain-containing protein [Eubacteriales bacterium]|nr:NYN domain-containing protein [Eubacteriales bacterium]